MPFKKKQRQKTRHRGIEKIGPDRYLVRVHWIDPKTGKRKRREETITTDKIGEAKALQNRLKGKERAARVTKQQFGDFAERWLTRHIRKEGLAPSTQARYVMAVGRLSERWGDWWIDAIDRDAIEDWQIVGREKHSNYTINSWHQVLRLILDAAMDRNFVSTNCARRVSTLRQAKTRGARGVSFNLQQFREFLRVLEQLSGESVSEDIARHIQVLAWSGMRMGESLALKFEDVDGDELRIERSVWGRQEKTTKTDDPRRITMIGPLNDVVTEQRKWLMTTQHPGLVSGLVFPARASSARAGMTRMKGDELSWYRGHSVLKKPLERVTKHAGLPTISAHSLRRTFEDLLREAGVDKLVRRAVAGWRTETAQAIYATVKQDERHAAAQAVLDLVFGGK